jgi:hypothetical protein
VVIVTGTKRSGTSLWMQILAAAGFPVFGEAFPGEWRRTLGAANEDGFYESMLREGIYYATNPHPKTGDYFFPEQVEWHCVKVFIPGLVRSDRAFIGRVVATVRNWREHEASMHRLRDLELEAWRAEHPGVEPPHAPPVLAPPLDWWTENFALIRDISIRRLPVHVQSYDGLLRDPERVVGGVLRWMGKGDVRAACEQVRPGRRHFVNPASGSISAENAAKFDELYAAIDSGEPLPSALLADMNATNERLRPLYEEHEAAVSRYRAALRERGAP